MREEGNEGRVPSSKANDPSLPAVDSEGKPSLVGTNPST